MEFVIYWVLLTAVIILPVVYFYNCRKENNAQWKKINDQINAWEDQRAQALQGDVNNLVSTETELKK